MDNNISKRSSLLERLFHLSEKGTNVKREIVAGMTTFMTMSYILMVIPQTLSKTGMPTGAVFTAAALGAIVGTLAAAFFANMPIAMASGLGLSSYFTYTVVITYGVSWQTALTAVFMEGIIFIIMTATNIREAIVNAVPLTLRHALSAGVGLFIAFIGFNSVGIVVQGEGTPLALGKITSPEAVITIVGILIIGHLFNKGKNWAMLGGIVVCTVIALILGITKLPVSPVSIPDSISPIFFKMDFKNMFTGEMMVVLLTFLFVDLFDTLGTLVGVAEKADLVKEDGKIEGIKGALFADAVGTTAGAVFGVSTVGTYVESSAGVAAGGRTGLTALSTAACFVVALLFGPLFLMVPSAATAPVLVLVGVMMMEPVKQINFRDFTEAIPAFLTVIIMPLAYSIADGVMAGTISYVALKLMAGRRKECSITLIILALLFVLKYIFM